MLHVPTRPGGMDGGPMSHVDYKKTLCHHVDFTNVPKALKGQCQRVNFQGPHPQAWSQLTAVTLTVR